MSRRLLNEEERALLVSYVDGELEARDKASFEARLAVDDDLRAELESFLRLDTLEHHLHAKAAAARDGGPRPVTSRRWGALALAAMVPVVVLAVALLQLRSPRPVEPLSVQLAASPEELVGAVRGAEPDADQWYLGFEAPTAGYLRLLSSDDLGAWHALETAPGALESSVTAGQRRLGAYPRGWQDAGGQRRTFAAFLLLFSEQPLAESLAAGLPDRLRGKDPEHAAQDLAQELEVRVGVVLVPGG